MDPVGKILNNNMCEICGVNEASGSAMVPLWDYGVRRVRSVKICKSCHSAHKKGVL